MLCSKPVAILRDDTWFDGTTKGMVHFLLSPSATTSTRCTPPRWSTPSLRCLCNKESLPQSVSRKWMRCCSLSTASTSAGSPTPTRSAPGCSTTLTRARLGCASRWSLEGKDNALLYADGRERETKPCCKKKSCTVCGWIDHAEQHRGGSEQGKAPGFAAPGDYSHGQYVVNLHDYCQRYNLYRLCSAGPVPHIVCTTADVPHRMYTVCTRMGWWWASQWRSCRWAMV